MAKLLKSIFSPNEKRKGSDLVEEVMDVPPPLDERRKLSISRSGRMKQANKKRHMIAIDLYGDNLTTQPVEKPKSIQYHVNTPISAPKTSEANKPVSNENKPATNANKPVTDANKPVSDANKPITDANKPITDENKPVTDENKPVNKSHRKSSVEVKTPEEEIDNAFEVIDNVK